MHVEGARPRGCTAGRRGIPRGAPAPRPRAPATGRPRWAASPTPPPTGSCFVDPQLPGRGRLAGARRARRRARPARRGADHDPLPRPQRRARWWRATARERPRVGERASRASSVWPIEERRRDAALAAARARARRRATGSSARPGGGLRVCPQPWLGYLPGGLTVAELRDRLRPLLDLPVELVLVSHGEPVLAAGGRGARRRRWTRRDDAPAYGTLAAVYEWLVPEPLLTPDGSVAAFDTSRRRRCARARACSTARRARASSRSGWR